MFKVAIYPKLNHLVSSPQQLTPPQHGLDKEMLSQCPFVAKWCHIPLKEGVRNGCRANHSIQLAAGIYGASGGDALIVYSKASKGILTTCAKYQQYPSGFYNSLLSG